jgi:hypothetical protein
MDSSNPHPGDQDSPRPDPGRGPADWPAQGHEPAQALTVPGSASRGGGQFWPPGRWRRPTQVAVGLGVAAAVVAGGVTAAVTAAGSPAPAAARTLAAGSGPIDADTAQLLTVLGLGGPPGAILVGPGGAILAGPGGAIAAGPGGAIVAGPAGEVAAGPGVPPVALRCGPPGAEILPGRLHGHVQRVIKGRIARIQREIRGRITRVCAGIRVPGPAAMYGQVTFQTKDGRTETAVFERGVIQSLSGDSLVVKAANGQTQTWQLSSDSQIRAAAIFGGALPRPAQVQVGRSIARNGGVIRPVTVSPGAGWLGRPASRSDLKAGRNVLVVGTVANGTRTVRLAVILPAVARAPAASVPPPSPAPSESSPAPSASGT